MEGKSSAHAERFVSAYLPKDNVQCDKVSDVWRFDKQVTANLPKNATENVSILKTTEL